jgi:hypothetical protein
MPLFHGLMNESYVLQKKAAKEYLFYQQTCERLLLIRYCASTGRTYYIEYMQHVEFIAMVSVLGGSCRPIRENVSKLWLRVKELCTSQGFSLQTA